VCALKGREAVGLGSCRAGEPRDKVHRQVGELRRKMSSPGTRQFRAERVFGTLEVFDSKDHGSRVRESPMKPVGKPDA
jgi:hypothetical protein